MIVEQNLKSKIKVELSDSKAIWIASAMISFNGWRFIQDNISGDVEQHFLIGIDLATEPKVFEELLDNLHINARVYQNKYTFHPKVYLFQKQSGLYTAFIGSSNATNWGLEKNVEMSFQVNDQSECRKLLVWFEDVYRKGYIVTDEFLNQYKASFKRIKTKVKQVEDEVLDFNSKIAADNGQFFSANHHKVFEERYHRVDSEDLKRIRKEVSDKLKLLHHVIYPKFKLYGLINLHAHHNSREIVSRHFFNRYSGYYINAIWLHYGKSEQELASYANEDKSINKPHSFINNIRLQVIMHKDSLGIWLVLGRGWSSLKDREYFREQMKKPNKLEAFFKAFKNLGDEYWIGVPEPIDARLIESKEELLKHLSKEKIDGYFIIACDINYLDERLSNENIANTILNEFSKLYLLYELMRHKTGGYTKSGHLFFSKVATFFAPKCPVRFGLKCPVG